MSSDLSERYKVKVPSFISMWWIVVDKKANDEMACISELCPDAEARARQLCAELNAAEAKKASEKS